MKWVKIYWKILALSDDYKIISVVFIMEGDNGLPLLGIVLWFSRNLVILALDCLCIMALCIFQDSLEVIVRCSIWGKNSTTPNPLTQKALVVLTSNEKHIQAWNEAVYLTSAGIILWVIKHSMIKSFRKCRRLF